jgi:hypothetical protein
MTGGVRAVWATKTGIWHVQVSFFIYPHGAVACIDVGNGEGVKQRINPSVSAAYHRIRMGII